MWIDFAAFLVACQVLTFGIIRIVEAIPSAASGRTVKAHGTSRGRSGGHLRR